MKWETAYMDYETGDHLFTVDGLMPITDTITLANEDYDYRVVTTNLDFSQHTLYITITKE